MQKQLDEAQQEIELLRKQMQDKDVKYAELVREKNNLEDSLLREQATDASPPTLEPKKPNVAAATPKSFSGLLPFAVTNNPEQKETTSSE